MLTRLALRLCERRCGAVLLLDTGRQGKEPSDTEFPMLTLAALPTFCERYGMHMMAHGVCLGCGLRNAEEKA